MVLLPLPTSQMLALVETNSVRGNLIDYRDHPTEQSIPIGAERPHKKPNTA
jgi:hypothetical protein